MKKIITIEGNIGAGKTTFIKKLNEKYPDTFEIIYEPVDIWINYQIEGQNEHVSVGLLEQFYQDPLKYGFRFQVAVIISQIEEMIRRIEESTKKYIIMDRCFLSAFHIFCEALLDDGKLDAVEYEILFRVMKTFQELLLTNKYEIKKHIYLCSDPDVCLDRIRSRGRPEEQGITLDYLRLIHSKHEKWLIESPVHYKVLTFYTNTDMFTNPAHFEHMLDMVRDEIVNHI